MTATRTLTRKGQATRQRIVEGAAAEFRARGVVETTLDHIAQATATSKGQLFHYFPSGREELLLAVARHESEIVIDDQQPYLGRLSDWSDWEAWRELVIARYEAQGQQCPLSMLISQLGRSGPAAREVTGELLARWQDELAAGIRRTQQHGEIDPGHDPQTAAGALVAAIQGGVVILLTTGRSQNLRAALDHMLASLRAAPIG